MSFVFVVFIISIIGSCWRRYCNIVNEKINGRRREREVGSVLWRGIDGRFCVWFLFRIV